MHFFGLHCKNCIIMHGMENVKKKLSSIKRQLIPFLQVFWPQPWTHFLISPSLFPAPLQVLYFITLIISGEAKNYNYVLRVVFFKFNAFSVVTEKNLDCTTVLLYYCKSTKPSTWEIALHVPNCNYQKNCYTIYLVNMVSFQECNCKYPA